MSGGNISVLIVFRGPNGTALGVGTQHSEVPCISFLVVFNFNGDNADAKGLLKATIKDPNPVGFLENKLLHGQSFPMSDDVLYTCLTLSIGKAKIEKEGRDVTIALFLMVVPLFLLCHFKKTKANSTTLLLFRYGQYFPVSDEVLDPSFTLPIGNAKYSNLHNVPVYNQYRSSVATTSSIVIGGGSEGGRMVGIAVVAATIAAAIIASSSGGKDKQMAKTGMAMVMLHYL
ncbi:Pyruvate dehydrogenase E1 component subunit beta-2, mitochondrial [Capsicum annuum]|nr:Pyruvate dehydrogenase E1 component subunit beta-2, mitochondrial [Capsicum annuum]